jgi:prefoldin subunit 5
VLSNFIIHGKRGMIKELEKQVRDLQRELADVQKDQAVLRLQPCRGDSEIRMKDEKIDELDRRSKIINESIRGLTRKLQLLISESNKRASCDAPRSSNPS